LCDLAERFAGFKKTGDDVFERVDSSFGQMLTYLTPAVQTGNEDFSRLTRWRLTMGPKRPGLPRFTSTLADNIERRVDERSIDALFECFDAVPGDPLVVAALSLYWPNQRHDEYMVNMVLALHDTPALARCYAAGTLINAGRSEEAVAVMNQALADAPNDPRVLRRAAKFNARLQQKEKAIELFEKALSIEPVNYETHRAYAWSLYNMDEPAKAAAQFHLAEDICGDMNSDIIAGLCLCAEAINNEEGARTEFQRLATVDPSWKDAAYIAGLRGWTEREILRLEHIRGGLFKEK
jgi:tetratricopeptide (TPR) repeat protein